MEALMARFDLTDAEWTMKREQFGLGSWHHAGLLFTRRSTLR